MLTVHMDIAFVPMVLPQNLELPAPMKLHIMLTNWQCDYAGLPRATPQIQNVPRAEPTEATSSGRLVLSKPQNKPCIINSVSPDSPQEPPTLDVPLKQTLPAHHSKAHEVATGPVLDPLILIV